MRLTEHATSRGKPCGGCNLFSAKRRPGLASNFAACMRELTDVHRPEAAFPAPEVRRVLRRLELHYVPKHASWLNMVEIEISVLRGQ